MLGRGRSSVSVTRVLVGGVDVGEPHALLVELVGVDRRIADAQQVPLDVLAGQLATAVVLDAVAQVELQPSLVVRELPGLGEHGLRFAVVVVGQQAIPDAKIVCSGWGPMACGLIAPTSPMRPARRVPPRLGWPAASLRCGLRRACWVRPLAVPEPALCAGAGCVVGAGAAEVGAGRGLRRARGRRRDRNAGAEQPQGHAPAEARSPATSICITPPPLGSALLTTMLAHSAQSTDVAYPALVALRTQACTSRHS